MATENESEKICGFSMSAPTPRPCIKGRCNFWVDTEKQVQDLIEEAREHGIDNGLVESEINEFRKEVGDGFCTFLNL